MFVPSALQTGYTLSMILFVEILCVILFIYGVLKTIPKDYTFDALPFFNRSLMAFGASIDFDSVPVDQPAPLCTWDDLDIERLRAQVARRSEHLILLNYGLDIGGSLAEWLSLRHVVGSWSIDELATVPSKSSDRLLILVSGQNCQRFLGLMKDNPGLRDHIAALFAIDPVWDEEWMSRHFNHNDMDAESHHAIPYVQLRFGPGSPLPQPPASKTGWRSINAIDLGSLDRNAINDALTPALAVLAGKLTA